MAVYCPFTGIEQTFPCCKWLDEKEGDGLIERELYEMVSLRQRKQKSMFESSAGRRFAINDEFKPKKRSVLWFASLEHPWSLWIWTSDLANAGSDADIYFQVYGDKGKSDEIKLDNKTDNFERGQVDRFVVSTFHQTATCHTLSAHIIAS